MKISGRHLPRLSIRASILLSCSVLCLLILTVGGFSIAAISKLKTDFSQYIASNRQSDWSIQIDQSIKEIQRDVLRRMHQGHQSASQEVFAKMTAMEQEIGSRLLQMEDDDEAVILKDLLRSLRHYRTTFQQAITERRLQSKLIQTRLPDLFEQLEAHTVAYHRQPGVNHSAAHVIIPLKSFRNALTSYFATLNYKYINQSEEQLRKLQTEVEQHWQGQSTPLPPDLAGLQSDFSQLEQTARRAVQATRGSLFLVNVVMSGHAAEMLHQANRLHKLAEINKHQTRNNLIAFTESTSTAIAICGLLAVLAGILFAAATARQISRPIAAITSTFQRLSSGETVEQIPGINHGTEIHQLAHAADVFRQRNAETENLLAQADSLTRQLQSKTRQLEAANSELEQFVYTVSHDLKSPIVASLGFLALARDCNKQGQREEVDRKLQRVEESTTRMGDLIKDLLELSRIGGPKETTKPIDTNAALRQLHQSMAPRLKDSGFSLLLFGPFPQLAITRSRFLQIMENLVSNALKYAGTDDPQRNQIHISYHLDQDTDCHVFSVRDFGPGIDPAFREKIFAPFQRLDPDAGKGSGIGLSIVRKLARFYKGDVWITDPPEGHGALFHVSFPLPQS